MRRFSLPAALLAVALAAPAGAQTTLEFSAYDCTVGQFGPLFYTSPFDVGGFRFTSTSLDPEAFGVTCPNNSTSFPGVPVATNSQEAALTTLTKIGGGAFSIQAIDLLPFGNGGQTVTFTGQLVGGGTTAQSFVLPAPSVVPGLTTFTFDASFANLSALEFSAQVSPYYGFTNLQLDGTFSAVPEPATVALTGGGLLALAAAVGRRRRA